MSFVKLYESAEADQQIKDLDVLAAAADALGLELRRGRQHFHTWANDRATADGKCLHSIGVKGASTREYEIGVVASERHPGAFALMYDSDSIALNRLAGDRQAGPVSKLMMRYQIEAQKAKAREAGMPVVEQVESDGTITLRISKTPVFT